MTRRHRCTWCGDLGATVSHRDAANVQHWFHAGCERAMAAWLRGWNPPAKPGPAWDKGTPRAFQGIRPRKP